MKQFLKNIQTRLTGIDEIIYKVIGVFRNIAVLFFLLFFLDLLGYWFFKMYLGYNYFSWVDHYIFNKSQ